LALQSKYNKRVVLDVFHEPELKSVGTKQTNQIKHQDRMLAKEKIRKKDKKDRATEELVLDPRTKMILYKMVNAGTFDHMYGCVSTGKEANVYYAKKEQDEFAVKIFKTSILVFKDRDRYVTGEYRFRHGYCRKNPRKMVKMWAEKEFRNLKRIFKAGIPCPEPLHLRQHVLVMKYIGNDGWPAPRLKDAKLKLHRWQQLYYDLIKYMRTMFWQAKLVHADLSEYNLLYLNKTVYIIDVSQSVEHDHPQAYKFLEMDCRNVNNWFRKQGLLTCTVKELFLFVLDPELKSEQLVEARIDHMMEVCEQRERDGVDFKSLEMDDTVGFQSWMPASLNEIVDAVEVSAAMEKNPAFAESVNRLVAVDNKGDPTLDGEEENVDDYPDKQTRRKMNPEERREIRRAHKQMVKSANQEKRKNKKVKKHVKKRIKKQHKRK